MKAGFRALRGKDLLAAGYIDIDGDIRKNGIRARYYTIGIGLICISIFSCLTGIARSEEAEERKLELEFQGYTVSAHIKNAPLSDVVRAIKNEKDIWVKGLDLLTEEEISVEFENIPIETGLGRIFSTMNYSLIFDEAKGLVGIMFLGKAEMKKKSSRRSSRSKRRRR